jgi:hypothetical protein
MTHFKNKTKVNLSLTVVYTLRVPTKQSMGKIYIYIYIHCYIYIICHVMKLCIAFIKMKEDSY